MLFRSDPFRGCDSQLTSLNLKPDFEAWLQETAADISPIYIQIYNNILFCKSSNARQYKADESDIKQMVFKLYIRMKSVLEYRSDQIYDAYLKLLYFYNCGAEDKCKELIQLVEECVYLWNGRLGDRGGTNIKNGVITYRQSTKYYLFKRLDVKFAKNINIVPLAQNEDFPNFSSTMRFSFKLKDSRAVIPLDIDYELYSFLLEVRAGYIPSNNDRKKNVKYDTFVRKLIAESDSDIYVYSRIEDGRIYRISKDDFDNYTFDIEV